MRERGEAIDMQYLVQMELVAQGSPTSPGAEITLVENYIFPSAMKAEIHSGHLCFLEKPLDLASAMLSFLANTKSGTLLSLPRLHKL